MAVRMEEFSFNNLNSGLVSIFQILTVLYTHSNQKVFLVSTLRDCSLCWDRWNGARRLHLTWPCFISMNVQPFSLHAHITHVCRHDTAGPLQYLINMPQAGFGPPIARTYSSTECENSALTIQATTAGLTIRFFPGTF